MNNGTVRGRVLTILAVFVIGVGLGLLASSLTAFQGVRDATAPVLRNLGLPISDTTADMISVLKDELGRLPEESKASMLVAKIIEPSVVHVAVEGKTAERNFPDEFFNDPFFKRFFPHIPRERMVKSQASGVIVSKDGLILTNHHVVNHAEKISVRLFNGEVYKGKVIGTDPRTEVAVIKIDANGLIPALLGDSDKLVKGQTVIAVGNPFGLSHTVTKGIVSATGRANIGVAELEDFIQTDAAINPGNSGGPLLNLHGEVIGINAAIISKTGAYNGIGLAIPINMARKVMDQIMKTGTVKRGFIGVVVQPLTPELAESFKFKGIGGVLVAEVQPDSPAAAAGLKAGDIIVEFDSHATPNPGKLRQAVALTEIGKEAVMKVFREGKEISLKITVGDEDKLLAASSGRVSSDLLGIEIAALDDALRERFGYPSGQQGVVITKVEKDSVVAGIAEPGMIILEINRKKIKSPEDYRRVVSGLKSGDKVLLRMRKDGMVMFASVTL